MAVFVSPSTYPIAVITSGADQAYASNTNAAIDFDTTITDPWGMFVYPSQPTRLTCLVPGNYLLGGAVTWASSSIGSREIWLLVNGATRIVDVKLPVVSGSTMKMMLSTVRALNVNDYVELWGNQDSGGSLNSLHLSQYAPIFWATRLLS